MALTFDATYYLTARSDVFQAYVATGGSTGLDWAQYAEQHYNTYGRFEGSNPNAIFNTNEYLTANPDVAAAGINPFDHYLAFGANEGRAPSASFPSLASFDWETYLAANPDLGEAGIDTANEAYAHYVIYGQFEGRPGVPTQGTATELTTGQDTLVGTDANDVFNAPLILEIFDDGPQANPSLQSQDSISGGAGTDTLVAELVGRINPRLDSVEILNLTSYSNAAVLDLGRSTGVQEIHNIDSRNDLEVENVAETVDLFLSGVRADTTIVYDSIEVTEQAITADAVGTVLDSVELAINGTLNGLGDVALAVSNGVYLDLDHDTIENFVLTGSGPLGLESLSAFAGLVTLDSTGYEGDLTINLLGSTVLESVVTGAGNDIVAVNVESVDGDFSADLGEGENTLFLQAPGFGGLGATQVSALDFTGGVANVQDLAFTFFDLLADADLNLEGFDAALESIVFSTGIDGNGNLLSILNGPETLTLEISPESAFGGFSNLDLALDTTVSLTVNALVTEENQGFIEIYDLDAAALTTLVLEANGYAELDIVSDADHNIGALETIAVTGSDYAYVDIDADDADADVEALKSISVTAGEGSAYLDLDGVAAFTGTAQTQAITIAGTTPAGVAGTVQVTIPGVGTLNVPVNVGDTTATIAANAAALIDGLAAYNATVTGPGVVTVTTAANGAFDAIGVLAVGTDATAVIAPPVAGVPDADGVGFGALEDVVVSSAESSVEVYIDDAFGAFTVTATAATDAYVELTQTGVTAVTVTAGTAVEYAGGALVDADEVNVYVEDAADLVSITVAGAAADIELDGDLGSFTTLDLSAVTTVLEVDVLNAVFGGTVTYAIGATTNTDDAINDVSFLTNIANGVREIFDFVGSNIGDVVIDGFAHLTGNDALDLSAFGINASSNLTLVNDGGDLVISAADGQFDGSITLLGLGAEADNVALYNILYA